MFQKIGNWFKEFFNNIGNFFVGDGSNNFSQLERIIFAIFIIIISFIIIKFILLALQKVMKIKKGPSIDKSAKTFFLSLIKVLLWVFVSFLVLNILNIDMSSFAGILSAITVALGLSLQDLIGSVAAGILILNQKNFVTDDYIVIDNDYGKVEGTVISISLVTTLLRTFNGQVVIIPNNNVIKSNITNYTKERNRRIAFEVNCTYDSDLELVKNILNDIINDDSRILKDPKPVVHLNKMSEYSLIFIMKMWTDFNDYWDVYNSLSEKILIKFRENNIDIPTSTTFNIKNNK